MHNSVATIMAGTLLGTLAPSYLTKLGRPTVYIGADRTAWTDSQTKIILPATFCGQPVEGDIAVGLVAHEIGHWFQDARSEARWLQGRPETARIASNILLDVALEAAITARVPSVRYSLQAVHKLAADAAMETGPMEPSLLSDLVSARFIAWPGQSGADPAGKLIAHAKTYAKRRMSDPKVMIQFLDGAARIAPELFENPEQEQKEQAPEQGEQGEESQGADQTAKGEKGGDKKAENEKGKGKSNGDKQDEDETAEDEAKAGNGRGQDDDESAADGDSGEDSDGESDGESDDQEPDGSGEPDEDGEDGESDTSGAGQGEPGEDADADASGVGDAGETGDGRDSAIGIGEMLNAGMMALLNEIAGDPAQISDLMAEVVRDEENRIYGDAPISPDVWVNPPPAQPWPHTQAIAAKIFTAFHRPNIRSTGLGTGSIDRRAIARGESPHVATLSVKRGRAKAQDVVIIVDASGSMQNGQKWELAVMAAEVIFLALKRDPENEVAIFAFANQLIRQTNPSSIDLLHTGCTNGGTSGAWIEGIWREYPHHTVIIITDGEMWSVPQSPSQFDKKRTCVLGIGTAARTMEPCADRIQQVRNLNELPGMMAGLIPQGYYA